MAATITAINPVREAITSGQFVHFVELVASATMAEGRVLEIAAQLGEIPGIVAAGITSYAGGSAGHDPIRIAAAAKARGLTPNVHITCVNRTRQDLVNVLEDVNALGIENVFAITGDYPKVPNATQQPFFAMDSVQLVELISEMREKKGMPFFISAAVSPFKYTEADCAYQYLKLEKKIAAGADFAITQLGFDSKKYRELKRYLDERGLKTPVLGNVYILNSRAADKFAKGEPPGCWASKELADRVREETQSEDKGLAARLERAAKMVAILKGLGYAGAYIGGDHSAKNIRFVLKRAEELAPNWEEAAEEIQYAPQGGFYFFESPKPAPASRSFVPTAIATASELFPAYKPGALRNTLTNIMGWVDKHPSAANALERAEFAFKSPVFGCQACGNCVLSYTEYVCPQTCPKNLRNGPCGGTLMGHCEVEDKQCIWVEVYDRAKAAGKTEELKTFVPARNMALKGTSSWVNYFLERDSRPGHDTSAEETGAGEAEKPSGSPKA
jgi:methylenetetrahydrofolate reductase (NADPH)